MSIENRAKQFMPFSALKGLSEALAKKESDALQTTESCRSGLPQTHHWQTREIGSE